MAIQFAPQIFGHERIRDTLLKCLLRDQLHPSLIFSGPQGIGKRQVALALAQTLNCQCYDDFIYGQLTGAIPCLGCLSCRKIQASHHPDVLDIQPTNHRRAVTLGQIREMLEEMALKPVEGRSRVFILEGADLLRLDAQNALLKTLEEPPNNTVTILIAERANALISTLHSRCQHSRFRPLSCGEVLEVLKKSGLENGVLEERARFSGGSPGMALAAGGRDRAKESLDLICGLVSGRAQKFPIDVSEELIKSLENGVQGPQARSRVLDLCLWLQRGMRDLLYLLATNEEPDEYLAFFLKDEIRNLVKRSSLVGLKNSMAAIDKTIAAMTLNQNLKLSVETLVIELTRQFS